MYSIILTDGKIVNIKANEVEWCEKSQIIRFIYERQVVAVINMNNVVGCKVEKRKGDTIMSDT